MKSRGNSIGALTLLLSGLVFLGGCNVPDKEDWEYEEIEVGYRGAAKVNPFLAVERFAERMGLEARSTGGLVDLPETDRVLIVPAESVPARGLALRLLQWAEEGGHVVYLLEGGDSFINDFAEGDPRMRRERFEDEDEEEDLSIEHPLLAQLEIGIGERKDETRKLGIGRDTLDVRIQEGLGFDVPRGFGKGARMESGGSKTARAFVSSEYGEGRITLLANAEPWRNRHIGEHDHARFLWEVLTLQPGTSGVWVVKAIPTSFWSLLVRYAWMPLVSLAFLTVFWLWKSMPRFGPVFPDPPEISRDFSEHLAMTGAFLWRNRCAESLLTPVRNRILRRQQAGVVVSEEEIFGRLAELSGLSEDRVRKLLTNPQPRDSHHFTLILRDLQKLDTLS